MASSTIIFVHQALNNNLGTAQVVYPVQNNSLLLRNQKENNFMLNNGIGVQKSSGSEISASQSILPKVLLKPSGLRTYSHAAKNVTLPSQVGMQPHATSKGNIDSVWQKELESEKFSRTSEPFVFSSHSIKVDPVQQLQISASNNITPNVLPKPSVLRTYSRATNNVTLLSQVGTQPHVASNGNIDSVCQKELEPENLTRTSESFVLSNHSIRVEPTQQLQISASNNVIPNVLPKSSVLRTYSRAANNVTLLSQVGTKPHVASNGNIDGVCQKELEPENLTRTSEPIVLSNHSIRVETTQQLQISTSNSTISNVLSKPSVIMTCNPAANNTTLPSQVGTNSHAVPKGNIDSVWQKELEPEKLSGTSEPFVFFRHSIKSDPMQQLQIKDTKIDLTKVSPSNATLQTVHQESGVFDKQLSTMKTENDVSNTNIIIEDRQILCNLQRRNGISCAKNVNSVLKPHINKLNNSGNQVSTLLNVQPVIKQEFSMYGGAHDNTVPVLHSDMQPNLVLEESNEIIFKAEPKLEIVENLPELNTVCKEKIKVEPAEREGELQANNSTSNLMEMSLDNCTINTYWQNGDIDNKQLLPVKIESDTSQNSMKLSITDIRTLAELCNKSESKSIAPSADKNSNMPCENKSEKLSVSLSKYRQKDIASFWPKEEEVPESLLKEIGHLKKLYVNNKCLICGFSSKSKRATSGWHNAKHMLVHLTAKCYKCDKCDKTFINSQRLLAHSIVHKNVYPISCDICGRRFRRKVDWVRHHKRYHTGVQIDSFACSVCSKTFASQAQVRRHYRTHTGEKPFYCSECNQGFSKRESLETHMNKHKGIKPHMCKECGRSFSNKKYLQNHMNLHSKENTFECCLCEMKFNFKSNLAQHMKTHSDDRCHTCDECGKSFKLPHHLRQHSSTHDVTGSSRYTRSRKRRKVIKVESSSSSDESIQDVDEDGLSVE